MTGGHGFLHSADFVIARNVAILLGVVFWLALVFWVSKDAQRRIRRPGLRFAATLIGLTPPFLGPIIYLLFRPAETLDEVRSRRAELQALAQHRAHAQPRCPVCVSPVEPDYLACPVCTTVLRQPCAECRAPLEPLWQICPYCTSPIEPSQIDLDAALTAETRTLSAVDDGAAVVPPV